MTQLLLLSAEDRLALFNEVSLRTALPAEVIEKDAWVTLLLEALYSLPGISEHLFFKGGTSLSKAYGLIDRFSEDIDFAMNPQLLGEEWSSPISKTKIKEKIRPASERFTREQLLPRLKEQLLEMGVPEEEFSIVSKADAEPDADPLPLYVNYKSVTKSRGYLLPRVEIEAGFRSLLEPVEERTVRSIISEQYPDATFSGKTIQLQAVRPDRTFLEKVFLLHEQYLKPSERALPRNRMSRHLYDLERLMDTDYATAALSDHQLYKDIVAHRKLYTPERGVSYDQHGPATILIVPPMHMLKSWETDYTALTQNMTAVAVGTKALAFDKLLERLTLLQERFRSSVHS